MFISSVIELFVFMMPIVTGVHDRIMEANVDKDSNKTNPNHDIDRHKIILSISGTTLAKKCPDDPIACLVKRHTKFSPGGTEEEQLATNKMVDLVVPNDASNNESKCLSGITFSSNENRPCKQCTVCSKDALILRPCTTTTDTVCSCEKGFFFSLMDNECKPCQSCPSGYGVWRSCVGAQNTVCRKCPPGTYSGILSGTLGCILCSSCLKGQQIMLQECSRNTDTICIAKSFDYQLKDHIPKSNKEPNDYTEENVLYIVVLVVFMFAVTACLLLHWKLRKMMKLHSGTIVSITPGSGTPERGTINYSVLQQQPQQQRHCNRIRYPTTCVPKVVSSEDTHLGLQIHV